MKMKFVNVMLLLVIASIAHVIDGYRILGIYPMTIKSHFIMINQLWKGLARKGHQVDVITMFPQNEKYPNYTQIITLPDNSEEILNTVNFNFSRTFNRNLSGIANFGYSACKNIGSPEFLKLARNPPKDPPYDVIITQIMNYHCYMVLGHLWNIPVVLVSTTSMYPWMHDMIGNPENIAFSSNNLISIPDGNTFWTRFSNAFYFYLIKLSYLYYSTNQDELLQKYFGPNVPSIRDLERSVSLVLMNTYFPINGVRPLTTGVIEVGGLHIQNDGAELTDNLLKWLNESKKGVIYFTFGSMMRIETFPKDIVIKIFEVLGKVTPYQVLIRIVNPEELPIKVPSNFYVLPWMPQEKVLQHPNIKLFITHCGLLGSQESVYYGVPMLCMPLIADQWTNSRNYVEKKIALRINIETMTKQEFSESLNELLNNSIYTENVKKLSRLFRDRPHSAMDTAVYWIEYVIRNGKDSLRSPAMDLTWWQVALLDVFAVVLAGISVVVFLVVFIIKLLLRIFRLRRGHKITKAKKRN